MLKHKNYDLFILITFILSDILSVEIFFFFILFSLIKLFFSTRKFFFPKPLILFLAIFSVTLLSGFLLSDPSSRAFLRDFFYFLSPIIYIYFSYYYFYNNKKIIVLFNTIVFYLYFKSIYLFGYFIYYFLNEPDFVYINYRESILTIGLIGPVFLVFIFFYRDYLQKNSKVNLPPLFYIILLLSSLLSFSRTILIVLIVSFLTLTFLNERVRIKILKLSPLVLLAFYFFIPYITSNLTLMEFYNKTINGFNELSPFREWTPFNIVRNWRGFEVHQALLQFQNQSIYKMLFGNGFGSYIFVGEFAYLVMGNASNGFIPIIHNGFVTLLLKGGIFSLLFYFIFLFLVLKSSHYRYKRNQILYMIPISLIVSLFFITFVVGGIFEKGGQFQPLFLIGLFYNFKKYIKI